MRNRYCWIAALVVVLGGCADGLDLSGPEATEPMSPQMEQSVVDGPSDPGGGEFPVSPRFFMELEALGELKPGAPIRLGWKVGARTDSHGVQVSLTLPEVEAARESDWGEDYRVQLDRKPERAQTWHGDLAEGEVKSGVLVFSVPAPGYYRVSFVAKAQDEMSPEGAETVYSTSGVRRVWLFVDDASGMVTSEFEPDRIPEGFKRAPGPRRSLSSKKKSRASFLPSNLLRRSAGLVKGFFGFRQGGTIPLEVIYYNDIDNDWYTVPEIYWEVNHKEWVGRVLTTTSTESGFTSNSGRLYPGCDGEEYQGWLEIRSTQIRLLDGGTPGFNGITDDDCDPVNPIQIDAVYDDEVHVMMQMDSIADAMESFFSAYRGRLDVDLRAYPETTSAYYPLSDKINLYDGHVWELGYSNYVRGHEFGHALHEKALGGLPSTDPSCYEHSMSSVELMKCAYFEGFAAYSGTVVGGYHTVNLENNYFYSSGMDGSRVQGPIAAFFWDLTDSGTEAHDAVSFPGSYVASIISSCQVNGGTRANGIDHLIYCFENQIDSLVTSDPDYFPSRSSDPTSYSESASEPYGWSSSVIRNLWVENLYGGG